jgi:hypothetical protein
MRDSFQRTTSLSVAAHATRRRLHQGCHARSPAATPPGCMRPTVPTHPRARRAASARSRGAQPSRSRSE